MKFNLFKRTPSAMIKSLHMERMRQAQDYLDRAREAAALSDPTILPREGHSKANQLPTQLYQSVGPRGAVTLPGRLVATMFPPGEVWGLIALPETVRHSMEPSMAAAAQRALLIRSAAIIARLESANIARKRRRQRSGFRSRMIASLTQDVVTGDSLKMLTPDYRLRVYRRDQYTNCRDTCGDIMYSTTIDQVDRLSLTEEQLAMLGDKPADLAEKMPHDRMADLYTLICWHPDSEMWVITQEVDGVEIAESEKPVSPYLHSTFRLVAGEDYGRGYMELLNGDLLSLNDLSEKELDFAAMASKWLWAMDYSCRATEDDLLAPSGSIFKARVSAGQVQDIAPLRMDRLADFSVVFQKTQSLRQELGKAMLSDVDTQPQQERVTRFQSQRFALENDMAMGGLYVGLADDYQLPLLQAANYQMVKDGDLEPLDDEDIEYVGVGGIQAVADEIKLQRHLQFAEILNALGPEAQQRIDTGILAAVIANLNRITEPGVVRSDEEVQAALAEQAQREIGMAAAQQGVQTAGAIAEAQARQ
jgi:hypothetical protein